MYLFIYSYVYTVYTIIYISLKCACLFIYSCILFAAIRPGHRRNLFLQAYSWDELQVKLKAKYPDFF